MECDHGYERTKKLLAAYTGAGAESIPDMSEAQQVWVLAHIWEDKDALCDFAQLPLHEQAQHKLAERVSELPVEAQADVATGDVIETLQDALLDQRDVPETVRRNLASNSATTVHNMVRLCYDTQPGVRRALAQNRTLVGEGYGCPGGFLANDDDPSVRLALAQNEWVTIAERYLLDLVHNTSGVSSCDIDMKQIHTAVARRQDITPDIVGALLAHPGSISIISILREAGS